MDFEKAFDTPPHELLKCKLFGYCMVGRHWNGYIFLCYRQQRVVNGAKSDWAPLLSSPIEQCPWSLIYFFVHYDISADIDSEIKLLEDDCACYRETEDTDDTLKLQKYMHQLVCWARKWDMRFQPVKCNMVQITRKRLKRSRLFFFLLVSVASGWLLVALPGLFCLPSFIYFGGNGPLKHRKYQVSLGHYHQWCEMEYTC